MFRKWIIKLVIDILSEWQYEQPYAKAKAFYRADQDWKKKKRKSFFGFTACGQDYEVDYRPCPSQVD